MVNNLNNMVVMDSLTHIYNRRFMDERLPADIVKATLMKQPLSVIFVDLDDMKAVNDTYGHIVGDIALKLTADAIRNAIQGMAETSFSSACIIPAIMRSLILRRESAETLHLLRYPRKVKL